MRVERIRKRGVVLVEQVFVENAFAYTGVMRITSLRASRTLNCLEAV